MPLFGHVKDSFGGLTLEHAHSASGAAMIMNRTSLPAAPAERQSMINWAGVHQIPPVALGRKLREWQEVCALNPESCQTVLQNSQRDLFPKFIQLCEPLFKRQVHALCLSYTECRRTPVDEQATNPAPSPSSTP